MGPRSEEAEIARENGAIDSVASDPLAAARESDCILLATPVFGILEWIEWLAPVLHRDQLVTDVGSTKRKICTLAAEAFCLPARRIFFPATPWRAKKYSAQPMPMPNYSMAQSGYSRR